VASAICSSLCRREEYAGYILNGGSGSRESWRRNPRSSLGKAYAGLANKAQFTEPEFVHDLTVLPSLLPIQLWTNSKCDRFMPPPTKRKSSSNCIGYRRCSSTSIRDVHVIRNGDRWDRSGHHQRARRAAQVIPVNYLRWDVIYSGNGDDWEPRMWKPLMCVLWICTLWNEPMGW